MAWPGESELDRTALERLPEAARKAVSRAPVPALVPRDEAMLERAVVTTGEHFFAFSATANGINVAVHGTRAAHRYDHLEPGAPGDRDLRGNLGTISRNEGIWSASWVEGGVAYTVDVECARLTDPRCANDDHIVARVDSLAFVGGHRGNRSPKR